MKAKTVITVLLLTSILVSCTPMAASTVAVLPSTNTPVPSATAIPTTERPHITLLQDTALYSGTSNVDFEVIKTLKAGDSIYPLGAYGDFIYIDTGDNNNTTGFIFKNILGDLPFKISELTPDSVPWKPLYIPSCSAGDYDAATNSVTFTNNSDGYYDTETKEIKLTQPLRVRIGSLTQKGTSYGVIKILGIPESQEPWWKGITRLDLANNNGYYQIGVRDGTIEGWNVYWDLPIKTSEQIQIIFEQVEGKSFSVLDKEGNIVKQVDLTKQTNINLPNGLFPQGNAYFGISTAPHASLVLTDLSVGIISNGQWVNQSETGMGLVELAQKHNLTLGTEFSIWNTMDIRYCQTMKRNFNVAVLSEFSWKGIWLAPGQYDFSSLDRTVDYAVQHGWRIRASHLVWGAIESNAIPDWLLKGNFTRDEYIQILEQHVKTMVGRYKGRVQEWSVANEAPSRSFYPGADFWNDKIGPDYIEMVFRWAKETDPNSILIFNDNNNESPRDSDSSRVVDKMYYTVKKLREKGVPIDVVGMQMHLLLKFSSPTAPQKDDVIATMQKFADLGVRIYITEFDVDLTKQPGTQTEKWDYEAQLYRDMLEACLESGVCDSFATWGISDSTSWITCMDAGCLVKEPNADPLMFDKEFNPKPAYFAFRDVLQNFSSQNAP